MRRFSSGSCLLIISIFSLLLTACASPANRGEITPKDISFDKTYPYSLKVQANGGSKTGALDTTNISNEDLKGAIEDAVIKSQLFKTVVKGDNGDYALAVSITSLSKPIFGATFSVDLELGWSLVRMSDKAAVMRKSIKTTGTATMGDALVAVTRLRLAVEAATRKNIKQGLTSIAELNI